jgi:hypothetical protein
MSAVKVQVKYIRDDLLFTFDVPQKTSVAHVLQLIGKPNHRAIIVRNGSRIHTEPDTEIAENDQINISLLQHHQKTQLR